MSRLCDRDTRPANLLGLVLFAHIAIDPRDAFTLAFQLSYLAVAGLIAGSALLARPLEKWLPPAVAVPVSVTAGAQAATLPLSLASFGAWYPVGFVGDARRRAAGDALPVRGAAGAPAFRAARL